jgi:hypothetical protein
MPAFETRIEVKVTAEMLALIEQWRRTQPQIPSRPQAVRELLAIALRAEGLADKSDPAADAD